MPRHERVNSITKSDSWKLDEVVSKTPGMSRYGNRARVSVMLPLNVAQAVAREAEKNNKTVNQVINDMLKSTGRK